MHQSFARYDTPINVSDIHGLGVTMEVGKINAGEIYRTTYQGPYGHLYAQALNVILNVNFNEDGTGSIGEGSFYPTEEVENCMADISVLPITDDLVYTSNLNAGLTIPTSNILNSIADGDHDHPFEGYNGGVPLYSGVNSGSVSLSTSEIFDLFPATPIRPTLCDGAGNCFDVILENGDIIYGGDQLPGYAGGFALKGNLESIAPLENDCADLYIEWHAIDGPLSGSGLGDQIGIDEDGDGTDFDRIWAMESLVATYVNPGSNCGNYNYPIFGDLTQEFANMGLSDCIDRVDIATEGYIYNLCAKIGDINNDSGWNVLDIVALANCVLAGDCDILNNACAGDINGDGGYNVLDIVGLANCVLSGNCESLDNSNNGSLVTYNSLINVSSDDSDHDYNGTDGRLVMKFSPMCIQDINVRYMMLEFVEIGGAPSCLDR